MKPLVISVSATLLSALLFVQITRSPSHIWRRGFAQNYGENFEFLIDQQVVGKGYDGFKRLIEDDLREGAQIWIRQVAPDGQPIDVERGGELPGTFEVSLSNPSLFGQSFVDRCERRNAYMVEPE